MAPAESRFLVAAKAKGVDIGFKKIGFVSIRGGRCVPDTQVGAFFPSRNRGRDTLYKVCHAINSKRTSDFVEFEFRNLEIRVISAY